MGRSQQTKSTILKKKKVNKNKSILYLRKQYETRKNTYCDAKIPISSTSKEDRLARVDIAAAFQCYILRKGLNVQSRWALKMEPSIRHLVISGGVTSNQYVRSRLDIVVKKNGLQLVCPPPWPCTDNGVMVAWTGIEHFRMGRYHPSLPAEEPEDFVKEQ
ncbi:putative tRNA N6-adenosine threonylcarbamoyltransferase [Arachis hypogaea]|nr:putative tRNA N6-adenosine threonylcarbamoyltransferase [Arachis hypogaea]